MLMHTSIGSEITGFIITDLNAAKAGGKSTVLDRQVNLKALVDGDVALGIPSILTWMKDELRVSEEDASKLKFQQWLIKGGGSVGAMKKLPNTKLGLITLVTQLSLLDMKVEDFVPAETTSRLAKA